VYFAGRCQFAGDLLLMQLAIPDCCLLDISVFGRSVYLTLISRRSNQFAGTRFLKRGGSASVSPCICLLLSLLLLLLLCFVMAC